MLDDIPSPGLLVSVTCAAEAAAAIAGHADVVDVKQPLHGALGRADARVVRQVVQKVAGRYAVTAAGGDLGETTPSEFAAWAHEAGAELVKVGIPATKTGAISELTKLRRALSDSVALAPALYADQSPPVDGQTMRRLRDAGRASWVVIDTRNKQAGGLLDVWTPALLEQFIALAAELSLRVVLAGKVQQPQLSTLVALRPALVGVRTAACVGGRQGRVQAALVDRLAAQCHAAIDTASGGESGASLTEKNLTLPSQSAYSVP